MRKIYNREGSIIIKKMERKIGEKDSCDATGEDIYGHLPTIEILDHKFSREGMEIFRESLVKASRLERKYFSTNSIELNNIVISLRNTDCDVCSNCGEPLSSSSPKSMSNVAIETKGWGGGRKKICRDCVVLISEKINMEKEHLRNLVIHKGDFFSIVKTNKGCEIILGKLNSLGSDIASHKDFLDFLEESTSTTCPSSDSDCFICGEVCEKPCRLRLGFYAHKTCIEKAIDEIKDGIEDNHEETLPYII